MYLEERERERKVKLYVYLGKLYAKIATTNAHSTLVLSTESMSSPLLVLKEEIQNELKASKRWKTSENRFKVCPTRTL